MGITKLINDRKNQEVNMGKDLLCISSCYPAYLGCLIAYSTAGKLYGDGRMYYQESSSEKHASRATKIRKKMLN